MKVHRYWSSSVPKYILKINQIPGELGLNFEIRIQKNLESLKNPTSETIHDVIVCCQHLKFNNFIILRNNCIIWFQT